VRNVLIRIKAQPQQGYKRLMDEVGLSTRNGGARDLHNNREEVTRPSSKHSNSNGHLSTPPVESPINRPYYGGMQAPFDPALSMQRTGSMESSNYEGYGMNNMQTPVYPTSNPALPSMAPMTPQQMQYQQMLAA
jgi:protein JSN1